MAPNDVKTVSVELTEAQAQQVLRTVEKDPDAGNWGEGNKVRNEVTSAFRSALGAPVREIQEDIEPVESEPEASESGDDLAPDEQPNTDEPAGSEDEGDSGSEEVPATPSEDGESESDEADRS